MSAAPSLQVLREIAAKVVEATLRELPEEIRAEALRVPIILEHLPGKELLENGDLPEDMLGLFVGPSLAEEISASEAMPAQIFLFLENIFDAADGDLEIFREEIRTTLLHELGHYLGWDEDDLAARGLE